MPVYSCRVSAVPFNQVWPGYQRPFDQAEFAGFAHWGMSGPVSVEIISKRSFTNAVVRPSAREVRPTVSGRNITFALTNVGQVTVELDGPHHALHLFADPPEASFSTNVMWDRAIATGRLFGTVLDGVWIHVGTPEARDEAEAYLRAPA